MICTLLLCVASTMLIGADDTVSALQATQSKRVGQSGIKVELRESSDTATFAITGLPDLGALRKQPLEDLQKHFSVRVQRDGLESNPTPLLGSYSISDQEVSFASRFPLSPSVQYRVDLSSQLTNRPLDDKPLLFSAAPRKPTTASSVAAVYPSSDVLPENVLKFYIHFSAPMSRGEAYKRVHLIQGNTEVEAPFLELGEELWDTEQKRFTLFIHPGRIKRGLKPREDIGIPISEGNTYRLQIDANWLGADLKPMSSPFVKTFRVSAADSQQPDPQHWKVTEPKANTLQPIAIAFDEPLDHALVARHIRVLDANQNSVHGKASTVQNETVWKFEPNDPWQAGVYQLRIERTIEDLAGNNLIRKFETLEQATVADDAEGTSELKLDVHIR